VKLAVVAPRFQFQPEWLTFASAVRANHASRGIMACDPFGNADVVTIKCGLFKVAPQ